MSIAFIPPGTRKDNPFWLVRGTIAGARFEISTGERDKARAEERAPGLIAKWLECRDAPAPGQPLTFKQAADRYAAWRMPSIRDHTLIDALVGELGAKALPDINHAALVAAAQMLYPGSKPQSWNRTVIAPAAAVLHYAADNGWCAYQRIKRFKEPAPVTRAIAQADAETLIAEAGADLKRLLIFLFAQGLRISDALALTWDDNIDLEAGTCRFRIAKTDRWVTMALAGESRAMLSTTPPAARKGKLFPAFRSRWRVYDFLVPLCKRLEIRFTPHMARHTLGARLNSEGAGLRTIMDTLGHRDQKSSLRYQSTDLATMRAALDRGTAGGKRRKPLK